jgi:hypothetical protein
MEDTVQCFLFIGINIIIFVRERLALLRATWSTFRWHAYAITHDGCVTVKNVGVFAARAAAIASGLCETVLITHGETGRSGVGRTRNVVVPTSLAGQFEQRPPTCSRSRPCAT